MKKTIQLLVISALILAAQQGFSQAGVSIGIKAGPNFAKINTDASVSDNYKGRTGFHGGAFVLFKLSKIGIQPEVIFSQQGSKVKVNTQEFDQNFSYINVPIIFKLYTVAGINLQVGPQFGFLSSAEAPAYDANTSTITLQDVKDKAKSSDFTLAMGLGWDLPFGLTVDARYNLGLSNMYKDTSSPSSEAKNQVIQVSVGYKLFNFGK
jgi:hypothetical protein